jgi:hypothetical protein
MEKVTFISSCVTDKKRTMTTGLLLSQYDAAIPSRVIENFTKLVLAC